MQYVSHRVVYTVLPKALQELPDSLLDNYIIQCIRQIDARTMYENKVAIVKAKNGVAELPADFIKGYGVYWNSKEPNESEYNALMSCLGDDPDRCTTDAPLAGSTADTTTNPVIKTVTPTPLQNRYNLVEITTEKDGKLVDSYILKNVAFDKYCNCSYHTNCWQPLKISDKLYTQCYLDKYCPNLNSDCPYRFSFDRCGHILTSMPDGWLKILYVGRPTNSNNDYLIPDNMDYINVLKQGVLMLYWEENRTNNQQGSLSNHREYERKFYNGVASLRGSALLPKGAVKDAQLRNIIYATIAIANDYSRTGNGGVTGGTLFNHMRIK